MSFLITAVTRPNRLEWWQWGQVLGVALPALLLAAGAANPFAWAVAAHFFMDFIGQSDETSRRKRNGDLWATVHHSFVSGGYPGLILAGLPGLALSVAIHFLIDRSNKFGLQGLTGAMTDQAAHILTLILIFWIRN